MGNAPDPVKLVHRSCRSIPGRSLRPKQSTEPPWYVIRMPGGVGGGRAVRPPPIPIKADLKNEKVD